MTKLPPHSLAYAVSDEEIMNKLNELITVIQVPEVDRGAWYESVRRFARESNQFAKAGGCFQRLADRYWPGWPVQED